jgi:site-specific DNA-adenine methylase
LTSSAFLPMMFGMVYPGGKGKTFQHIVNVLPPHDIYIETHLGGGAVLRRKAPARRSIGVDLDPAVIGRWRENAPELAEYVQADAVDFLARYRFRGDEVVYCDPPYLPETRRRKRVYRCDYLAEDHERLLETLCGLACRVVISGYPSALYAARLAEWQTRTYRAKAHDGLRTERIWFNFDPPDRLHDARYLGADFRERDNIRRRQVRLRDRIAGLSVQEQCVLAEWLNGRLGEGGAP